VLKGSRTSRPLPRQMRSAHSPRISGPS
jgi:hypothetical protein